MSKYHFIVPEGKKVRYIVHTDCKNEADDQYTVAHALLSPKLDVKAVIAAHFDRNFGRYASGATTKASYDEAVKVIELMGLSDQYKVLMGATTAMQDANTPIDSEGARAIVEEAMKDDPRPLYIGLQGAITDLACAILMEPEICHRMTAIWIGGGDYPEGGQEFNLGQDVIAANIVFQSEMPVWQVPMSVYKNFAVSLAELQDKVEPCGEIGAYLFKELTDLNVELGTAMPDFDWPHGEIWGLGDEGVIAALMMEEQRTDTYDMIPAPLVDPETLKYLPSDTKKMIRVYKKMDYRLTLEDLFCKLRINYGK